MESARHPLAQEHMQKTSKCDLDECQVLSLVQACTRFAIVPSGLNGDHLGRSRCGSCDKKILGNTRSVLLPGGAVSSGKKGSGLYWKEGKMILQQGKEQRAVGMSIDNLVLVISTADDGSDQSQDLCAQCYKNS